MSTTIQQVYHTLNEGPSETQKNISFPNWGLTEATIQRAVQPLKTEEGIQWGNVGARGARYSIMLIPVMALLESLYLALMAIPIALANRKINKPTEVQRAPAQPTSNEGSRVLATISTLKNGPKEGQKVISYPNWELTAATIHRASQPIRNEAGNIEWKNVMATIAKALVIVVPVMATLEAIYLALSAAPICYANRKIKEQKPAALQIQELESVPAAPPQIEGSGASSVAQPVLPAGRAALLAQIQNPNLKLKKPTSVANPVNTTPLLGGAAASAAAAVLARRGAINGDESEVE